MKEIKAYLGNDPYIFVSYSHKNKNVVYPFIAALQEHYNVWFDEGIHYGQEWETEIAEKLENCTVFLYMITEESLDSANCKDEIHFVRELGKPFLNVLVNKDTVLPKAFTFRYGRYQMCSLFAFSSCEEAVDDLAKKCEALGQMERKSAQKKQNFEDAKDDPKYFETVRVAMEKGRYAAARVAMEEAMDKWTYLAAVRVAIEEGTISTSLLVRRLGTGFALAAKLIDRMQSEGIVSLPDGSKPRTVLITADEFWERFTNDKFDSADDSEQ